MTTQDNHSPEMAAVMAQWMDQAARAWKDLMQPRPAPEPFAAPVQPPETETNKGGQKETQSERYQWDAALDTWRTFFESLTRPETLAAITPDKQAVPPIFSQLATFSWQAFADLQQSLTEQLRNAGKHPGSMEFAYPEDDTVRRWSEFYETEIRKYLTVPQLGLHKFSQENIQRMLDRFNAKQFALAEFFELLYRPVKEGAARMQKKAQEWIDTGQFPDDPKAVYREWLRFVEGRFMLLFKSEEFIGTLQKAVMTTLDFHNARKEVFEEAARYFSIPTGRDLDDVYRELHNLKQQVRAMESQLHEYTAHAASAATAG